MISLLLRPKILGFKNRIVHAESRRKQFSRDLVVGALSVLIISVIFSGSLGLFASIRSLSEHIVIHPSAILSLFMTVLMLMLLLSSLISALSVLYLSQDLERLLASPIRPITFFWGKWAETVQAAGWMLLVFAGPTFVAFAVAYSLSPGAMLLAAASIVLLMTLPGVWSMTCAVLFARFFPLQQTRRILYVLALLGIISVYLILQLIGGATPGAERNRVLSALLSHLTHPAYQYLPSHWSAVLLGELAEPTGLTVFPYWSALISLTVASAILAHYVLVRFYHTTYSESIQRRREVQIDSRAAQRRSSKILFFLRPETRALVNKELKLFARDMSQALQLMLLIGLCAIYLYNFGTVSLLADSKDASMPWWQPVLTVINFVMGTFVVTAVCSRFVFPTISYEGKSFWILCTAPLTTEDLLRAKFWIWFWPVCITATIILTSGALAIQAPVPVVIGTAILAAVSTYGIVGLAVGLGTLFSFFDWEHASQLSANLGSLFFMIASMFLVGLAIAPVGLMLCLYFACAAGYLPYSEAVWMSLFVSGFLLLYMHVLVHRWAIHAGVAALERKKIVARY